MPNQLPDVSSPAVPRRYFGTDGVRGIVGQDLTTDLVERLGRAATVWSGRGRIFVGRDTRASGPELEDALA
ncbi:MAG: phosphoglucosamine mutase, partial [Gaiellaceae bacterium]|nr:phosphoglucosamine mutase [Gaiellaceae bacterium]